MNSCIHECRVKNVQDDPIYRLKLHEVHTIEQGPAGTVDVMAVHGGFIYAFRGGGFGVFVPYDRVRDRAPTLPERDR
jgi:hypothetical protein